MWGSSAEDLPQILNLSRRLAKLQKTVNFLNLKSSRRPKLGALRVHTKTWSLDFDANNFEFSSHPRSLVMHAGFLVYLWETTQKQHVEHSFLHACSFVFIVFPKKLKWSWWLQDLSWMETRYQRWWKIDTWAFLSLPTRHTVLSVPWARNRRD